MKEASQKSSRWWVPWFFLLPSFAGFCTFMLLPIGASLCMAFCNWDILSPPRFIGFQNFVTLLHDRDFWSYLGNTLYFMLGIPIQMAVSLFLAILVDRKIRGIVFFRTIFFLPVVSSLIAVAMVWRWIYHPEFGVLNELLRWVGVSHPPRWLGSLDWGKPSIIIMEVWRVAGYDMLLYLAALQAIPQELYEAAEIDGANAWEKFWHVTWPMLSFVNFFVLVTRMIGGFQIFGQIFVMTQGGPAGSTTSLVYYIYRNAFEWFRMGYASAIAWVLFLLMLGVTLLQWKLGQKRQKETYG